MALHFLKPDWSLPLFFGIIAIGWAALCWWCSEVVFALLAGRIAKPRETCKEARCNFGRCAQVSIGANEIASLLACPYDGLPLSRDGRVLKCPNEHAFPIVDDVPVLLRSDVSQTMAWPVPRCRHAWADVEGRNDDPWFVDTLGIADEQKNGVRMAASRGYDVDPVVSHLVAATNGILYKHVVGLLTTIRFRRSGFRRQRQNPARCRLQLGPVVHGCCEEGLLAGWT